MAGGSDDPLEPGARDLLGAARTPSSAGRATIPPLVSREEIGLQTIEAEAPLDLIEQVRARAAESSGAVSARSTVGTPSTEIELEDLLAALPDTPESDGDGWRPRTWSASTHTLKPIEERRSAALDQAEAAEAGRLGPKLRVLKVLGEGGMGTVYAAEHLVLQRKVAVKVLSEEMSREPRVVERLRREADAARRVRHPSVVEIFGIETSPAGRPMVVMELLEGWNLAARLQAEGPLELGQALTMGISIAQALDASHQLGVVHRDVKPGNIFLAAQGDEEARFKLLDFGAAAVHDAKTLTVEGAIVGTPAYMSPEQAMGRPVSERTDVYSLGLVLYEAITGQNPFSGHVSVEDLIIRVVTMTPEPPTRGEHPDLDQVILRALAKAPEDRLASAAAFAEALEALAAGSRPAPDLREPPRPRSREQSALTPIAQPTPAQRAGRRLPLYAAVVLLAATAALYMDAKRGPASVGVSVGELPERTCDVALFERQLRVALERVPNVVLRSGDDADLRLAVRCGGEGASFEGEASPRSDSEGAASQRSASEGAASPRSASEEGAGRVRARGEPDAVAARLVVEIGAHLDWQIRASLRDEAARATAQAQPPPP